MSVWNVNTKLLMNPIMLLDLYYCFCVCVCVCCFAYQMKLSVDALHSLAWSQGYCILVYWLHSLCIV